ncbi:polysaccharide pyruvyl transferase family protein [Bifidobacterium dentium]|uniref:polysaccharide pyruvyl transferase family protein n=1 Tax=Bifidobacterium dentium TaxID=1689 RepID=UPI0018B0C11D|nr:polysaccharide pyruvyl transferase family protein [Bifidobacterium dentium]MBF9690907.1 polysaccharide pyruvyl transferase family protein [Bifidobacterium dentium]
MATVGIMSMQRIANYGSFLQAYALKTMIEELGHSVQFVDYRVCSPVIQDVTESSNKLTRMVKKGLETFAFQAPLQHKLAFIKFKKNYAGKYLPLLGITDDCNYSPKLDCMVIGSDEVFNCIQKNTNVGFSPELFGANSNADKVITYAASFGNTTLTKLQQYGKDSEIGSYLQQLSAISVRDNNSGRIVKALTGETPEYHLDPVLAYDYFGKCKKIPKFTVKERYLILYAYSGRITDAEADWIADYAKRKGLKIYAIGGVQKCADRFIDCSPFEVLAYFKGTEEVITDTFHGSIFSTIAHKPFTTIIRKSVGTGYGNEEKLTDLLERLGLTSRMTTDVKETDRINSTDVDYEEIDDLISMERLHARQYLARKLGR